MLRFMLRPHSGPRLTSYHLQIQRAKQLRAISPNSREDGFPSEYSARLAAYGQTLELRTTAEGLTHVFPPRFNSDGFTSAFFSRGDMS
jgi:hypothetical protein